jgi:hypothetical protein
MIRDIILRELIRFFVILTLMEISRSTLNAIGFYKAVDGLAYITLLAGGSGIASAAIMDKLFKP